MMKVCGATESILINRIISVVIDMRQFRGEKCCIR